MAKPRIRDLVVVLPGMIGSVLEKDGKDLWAVSGSALWRTLITMGGWLEKLRLDDPDADDGVVATRLMSDVHLIPGLVKIDGYTGITRMIQTEFEVIEGSIGSDAPANYFEYPYDWRRDNRRTATELDRFIKERLSRWRDYTNNPEAKTILIAHSMGGLVSRHFCEVLGGWEICRALITFGTPHRGSASALSFLGNGYKKLFVDLTEALRSFPSAYQLLPIYPIVSSGDELLRVAEADIPGIDRRRAEEALAFHREIETAVAEHVDAPAYRDGFTTLPMVGTRQPTLQSATLEGGRLAVGGDLPLGVDPLLGDGDGTVPRLSAIPIELSTSYQDTFVAERHSSLLNHRTLLQDVRERLVQMQTRGLSAIRGPTLDVEASERAALSVELDDIYLPDEPVTIAATIVNGTAPAVIAVITPLDGEQRPLERELDATEGGFIGDFSDLAPNGYRLEIRTQDTGPAAATPVHDVFAVAG